MKAYRSKWGYHPCDYETFVLLKLLNARWLAAQRGYAQRRRWFRKKPANRVMRRCLRDSQGRKIGREIVGPLSEPRVCPLFCERASVICHWSQSGEFLPSGRTVDGFALCAELGIPEAYRAARTPLPSVEAVRPLSLTAAEIRRLAADLAVHY
jgi:hypothetical protein